MSFLTRLVLLRRLEGVVSVDFEVCAEIFTIQR